MSRTLFLSLGESEAIARCAKEKVGVSAIESLPSGGVRLVCMSSDGAQTMRAALKSKIMATEVAREPIRPRRGSW